MQPRSRSPRWIHTSSREACHSCRVIVVGPRSTCLLILTRLSRPPEHLAFSAFQYRHNHEQSTWVSLRTSKAFCCRRQILICGHSLEPSHLFRYANGSACLHLSTPRGDHLIDPGPLAMCFPITPVKRTSPMHQRSTSVSSSASRPRLPGFKRRFPRPPR